jgi:hypothetical protein
LSQVDGSTPSSHPPTETIRWTSAGGGIASICPHCGVVQLRYGTALLQLDPERLGAAARCLRDAVAERTEDGRAGQPVVVPFGAGPLSLCLEPDQLRDLAEFLAFLVGRMPIPQTFAPDLVH